MEIKDKQTLSWLIAAGIVGADIGTSVFYSTGILFPIVGYWAPLFILIVCGFMWLFKRTYEEGLALSPYNGGAYVMILRSVGRRAAVLAGSLTAVSYLATAAVSSLSGAYYLTSLFDIEISGYTIAFISFFPLVFFGLLNTRGIKEPAKIVTGIAGFHFALLLIMGVWGIIYLFFNDPSLGRFIEPTKENLTHVMFLHGFAAAFLGITGFESAAQIVEELEQPALVTVRKLYKTVVILVSLTGPVISFLCLAALSHDEVVSNKDNLVSILGYKMGGTTLMTIIVFDATLTLFAATNTAFVGFIGLATTMAKQGNLPQILLTRVAHKFPTIQGYPMIALPFMAVAMLMTFAVPHRVEVLAEVYGMTFLGVMVSFAIGVVLMRNRRHRRDLPREFLTKWIISTQVIYSWLAEKLQILTDYKAPARIIPIIPLVSGIVLASAQLILVLSAPVEAQAMLVELLSLTLVLMAFYRWGVLETRLETRSDLRLGLGQFSRLTDLPDTLPKYVLCAGGTGARRLINTAIKYIIKQDDGKPFELIVFHAEEDKDPQGFVYESLQRIVSQQIATVYNNDIVLTVKILPGTLHEGLMTLKKTVNVRRLYIGTGRNPGQASELLEDLSKELEVDVINLGTVFV